MINSREQAFKRLREDLSPLPDGEPFTVGLFRPEDAYGVARLMYSVYGEGHPIDTYYIPEKLTSENQAGRIISAVARTTGGAVVCHQALYRSAAPNPELFELGMGLTLPAYRGSLAFAHCSNILLSLAENGTVKALFGEAVCNHTITQKLCRQAKATETALEVGLMPAAQYSAEGVTGERVSCLMAFRTDADQLRHICIPDCYREQICFMMEGLKLDRTLIEPDAILPDQETDLSIEQYESAGVCRCSIRKAGYDLAARLERLEQELLSKGYALLQCFIPLGNSSAAATVDILRANRFFLGGFLPVWFGDDGLLMQKLFVEPEFEGIKLHSERSRTILELVIADWKRSR